MARRRVLHPEEKELWLAVARTARSLHKLAPPERPAEQAPPLPVLSPPVVPPPRFRIGEKAPAPPRPGTPQPSPLQMDAKTHTRMIRGKLAPEARIDLHGMTVPEAHAALIAFVLDARASGRRLLLVITGKGARGHDLGPIPQRGGALRQQAPQWLRLPPLGHAVLQVTEAHQRHGGAGAFYVYLRRG